MANTNCLSCTKCVWNGRQGYLLGNGLIRLVVLIGGGHIAEFRFDDSSGLPSVNPLWIPHWKTIEPFRYRANLHARGFGSILEGKLLSGLVGHNICLDYFGLPSAEEAAQGLSEHGEAPSARWRMSGSRVSGKAAALTLLVRLPVSFLELTRHLEVRKSESVVYFEETVYNERKADHFFHWAQHVTLGPTFLSKLDSTVSLPGSKGLTFPHGYDEGKALLASNRTFQWPRALQKSGGTIDLSRPWLKRGSGFVVAVLLDPRRAFGFVAAVNSRLGLLIAYCFRRCDFPWVAVWEEHHAISAPPWRQREQARGLEFTTTPLPVLRRESFALGPLFGQPTLACVPARGRKTLRYLAALAQIPKGFRRVRDIKLTDAEIVIKGDWEQEPIRVSASRLRGFMV
jgi:hypothetical protein